MPVYNNSLDVVYRSYGGQFGGPIGPPRSEPQGIAAIHHVVMLIINALLPSRSPWRVMRRGRTARGVDIMTPLDTPHPVDYLLHNPTKGWTPDRFFTTTLYYYLTLGNVGLRIGYEDGIPTSLWPGMFLPYDGLARPGLTSFAPLPSRGSRGLVEIESLRDENLIRLMWPGGDDEMGPSPLYTFCRFATNIILGIEEAQEKRLSDLASYGAMIEVAPEAYSRATAGKLFVRNTTKDMITAKGVADRKKTPLVLKPGHKLAFPANMPMTDANAIQLQRIALHDVALVYNLPSESLVESTKFSKSAEEAAAAAYRDCFDPIARRVASELTEALLTDDDKRDDLQIVIDLERYQVSSRTEAFAVYGKAFAQDGLISREEAREMCQLREADPDETFVQPRGTGGEDPGSGAPPQSPQAPREEDDDGDLTNED